MEHMMRIPVSPDLLSRDKWEVVASRCLSKVVSEKPGCVNLCVEVVDSDRKWRLPHLMHPLMMD
jgi:hypothetical protein